MPSQSQLDDAMTAFAKSIGYTSAAPLDFLVPSFFIASVSI